MSLEDRLFQQRYHKIREIENLGFEAYPRKYSYSHTPTEVREGFEQKTAEELGINTSTLYRKIKKLGLKVAE